MKKLFLIGIGFALAVAVFGVAGFAYAQTQYPPEPQTTDGPEFPYGRAGWSRGSRGGTMDGQSAFMSSGMMSFAPTEGEEGPLHDYVFPAMAEAFGLTDEQIEAFEIARETMQSIRADLSQDEIRAAMQQAFTTAIENALADDAITEEQAAQWLERLDQMGDRAPGMIMPGNDILDRRSKAGSYMQGVSTGFRLSRQMMLNHEYMDAAIADALDISVEELDELRSADGFSWQTYAAEQGLSDEEISAMRTEIFTNAVSAALEEGSITQEQADWVLERLENLEASDGWFGRP